MSSWSQNIKKLKIFFEKNGHSRVPMRYKEDLALGRWVQKVRISKEKLSTKQLAQLDALNFVWSDDIRKEKHKKWLLMIKRLEKFKEENGHCRVPSKYEPDKKLGRWVEVQRTRKTHLEDWQIQKLETLGFVWSHEIQIRKKAKWYEMYRRLEVFYKKYGHSDVPEYWSEDVELSIWVISQRRPKKPLPENKITLLNTLNFSWNKSLQGSKRKRNAQGRFISSLN